MLALQLARAGIVVPAGQRGNAGQPDFRATAAGRQFAIRVLRHICGAEWQNRQSLRHIRISIDCNDVKNTLHK